MLFPPPLPLVHSHSFQTSIQASILRQDFLELFHSIKSSYPTISKYHIPLLCSMSQNCNCALISVMTNICFLHLESKDLSCSTLDYMRIDIAEAFVVECTLNVQTFSFIEFLDTIFYFSHNFLFYVNFLYWPLLFWPIFIYLFFRVLLCVLFSFWSTVDLSHFHSFNSHLSPM